METAAGCDDDVHQRRLFRQGRVSYVQQCSLVHPRALVIRSGSTGSNDRRDGVMHVRQHGDSLERTRSELTERDTSNSIFQRLQKQLSSMLIDIRFLESSFNDEFQ